MTLTRREFIKHSGIAAGALVVTSAAPLPAWAEEKGGKILTAGRWGAMNVEVKDGKIVSSTGALAKTIPNSLQSTAADQVHTTARIQHPMVRKSYLDNPLQPAKGRGEDTYVQVSWEQALKLIHEQHDRIRKANGPSAIFAGSISVKTSSPKGEHERLPNPTLAVTDGKTTIKFHPWSIEEIVASEQSA